MEGVPPDLFFDADGVGKKKVLWNLILVKSGFQVPPQWLEKVPGQTIRNRLASQCLGGFLAARRGRRGGRVGRR